MRLVCWFLASGVLFAQAPAPQAPAKGSIEGQVINATTGTPLKKATVRLTSIRSRQVAMPGGGGVGAMPAMLVNGAVPNVYTNETDDTGHFHFTGLEAGKYNLSAERTGFLRQSYGARKYSGASTPLILSQDQRMSNLVFKMSPQSVIIGKILDEDGEPMANVQVQAHRYTYMGGKRGWQRVNGGQTSDIGEYRIPNLEPGRYLVSADARNLSRNIMQAVSNELLPNVPDMMYANTYFPNSLDSTNAQPIEVGPGGEIRGIDVRLRKSAVYRVRGKVVLPDASQDAARRGMAMVQLWRKDSNGMIGAPLMGQARPPENRFEIRGVSPGTYILHTQFGNGNAPIVAFQEVQVGGGHVDGLVLTPAAGRDVQGTVKVEGATAPVTLSNLSVFVRSNVPIGNNGRGKVADNGGFTLNSVQPIPASVTLSGMPENCFLKSVRYGGQEIPESGIDLSTGGTVELILSATAGEVDAVVVDKDGKPAIGAIVALYPKEGKDTHSRSTDENGSAVFKGLKPGEYKLVAWEDIPQGAAQDPDFVKKFDGRGETAKLEPSGKQAVQLKVVPVSETEQQ